MKRISHHRGPAGPAAPRVALVLLGAVVWAALSGCTVKASDDNPLGKLLKPLAKPTPSELAREAFDWGNPDKRRRAIALLSSAPWGGEDTYVRLYRLSMRTDNDDTVVAAAVSALGRHGTVDDVPLIADQLKHDKVHVRLEAAKALQKVHNPQAIKPLITHARKDIDPDVRMACVEALGQYAEPPVFDALVGAVNDRDFGVEHAAQASLHTLTGQDFGLNSAAWLQWGAEHRDDLFADRRQYVWQPYNKPRGLLDKAQFWKKHQPHQPRLPTGDDQTASQSEPQPSS